MAQMASRADCRAATSSGALHSSISTRPSAALAHERAAATCPHADRIVSVREDSRHADDQSISPKGSIAPARATALASPGPPRAMLLRLAWRGCASLLAAHVAGTALTVSKLRVPPTLSERGDTVLRS
jgi:hypothetical protein